MFQQIDLKYIESILFQFLYKKILIYLVDRESLFLAAICSGLSRRLVSVLRVVVENLVRIKFKPLGMNFAAKWMQLAPSIHLSSSTIISGERDD